MDIHEAFTHKIGPLPAIAWAGSVGAIYVGYHWFKHLRGNSTNDGTGLLPVGTPDLGSATDFNSGYSDASGSYSVGAGANPTTTTSTFVEPPLTNNVDWGKRVVNWLISQNADPSMASSAIGNYLAGIPQTSSQADALVNEVLLHFGVPPDGVQIPIPAGPRVLPVADPVAPIPTAAAPTPSPQPTSPQPITVAVKKGDTLWTLFHNAFGRYPTVTDINNIAALNHLKVSGSGSKLSVLIYPGQTIRLN